MIDSRRPLRYLRTHYLKQLRLIDGNFEWRITGRWMAYSTITGLLGAIGAIVFAHLVHLSSTGLLTNLIGYHPPEAGVVPGLFDFEGALHVSRRWLLFIIPTLGGLLSGWIVFRFAPEAEGHGTDAVIKAFHRNNGVVRPRVAIVKTLASAVTLGSGGSAGKEGPIAQIASTMASEFAGRMGLTVRDRRILLIAGMAAGIGAIFQSPLGGAFFAVEVLYREDLESEGIMPSVVAAITGYSVYSMVEGSSTVFITPSFEFIHPGMLLPLIIFAFVCAVLGIYFTKLFYGTRRFFEERISLSPTIKPAIGGLLVGSIAFFFPAILGSSYGWLQEAINGNLPLTFMLILVFAKMLATSFTIGSGGSGGVFAPSLVIGGMFGGVFGLALEQVAPGLVGQPEAYVLIGMATFFTGVANVPIATTIMISEMTGSYSLLVPLIFSSVIAHLFARKWSLYTQQARNHYESPAHLRELHLEHLEMVAAEAIMERAKHFHTVTPDQTLEEIESVFARTREVILPVVPLEDDFQEPYIGLVLLDDLQPFLGDEDHTQVPVTAADIMVRFVSLNTNTQLEQIQETFEQTRYPELPVTDDMGEIVGFIKPAQLVSEHHRALLRMHQHQRANQ